MRALELDARLRRSFIPGQADRVLLHRDGRVCCHYPTSIAIKPPPATFEEIT